MAAGADGLTPGRPLKQSGESAEAGQVCTRGQEAEQQQALSSSRVAWPGLAWYYLDCFVLP